MSQPTKESTRRSKSGRDSRRPLRKKRTQNATRLCNIAQFYIGLMQKYLFTLVSVPIYANTRICMHIQIHMTYIYIYKHTHTHTRKHPVYVCAYTFACRALWLTYTHEYVRNRTCQHAYPHTYDMHACMHACMARGWDPAAAVTAFLLAAVAVISCCCGSMVESICFDIDAPFRDGDNQLHYSLEADPQTLRLEPKKAKASRPHT